MGDPLIQGYKISPANKTNTYNTFQLIKVSPMILRCSELNNHF